jgi:hypothetical protein
MAYAGCRPRKLKELLNSFHNLQAIKEVGRSDLLKSFINIVKKQGYNTSHLHERIGEGKSV